MRRTRRPCPPARSPRLAAATRSRTPRPEAGGQAERVLSRADRPHPGRPRPGRSARPAGWRPGPHGLLQDGRELGTQGRRGKGSLTSSGSAARRGRAARPGCATPRRCPRDQAAPVAQSAARTRGCASARQEGRLAQTGPGLNDEVAAVVAGKKASSSAVSHSRPTNWSRLASVQLARRCRRRRGVRRRRWKRAWSPVFRMLRMTSPPTTIARSPSTRVNAGSGWAGRSAPGTAFSAHAGRRC